MAHNVKLIKNNIIRVSNVKYMPSSTQINEKNIEKNVSERRALEQQNLSSEDRRCQTGHGLPSSSWRFHLPHRRHSLTEEYLLTGKSFHYHAYLAQPKTSGLQILPYRQKALLPLTCSCWRQPDAASFLEHSSPNTAWSDTARSITYNINDSVYTSAEGSCRQSGGTCDENLGMMVPPLVKQKREGRDTDEHSRVEMLRQTFNGDIACEKLRENGTDVSNMIGDNNSNQGVGDAASLSLDTYLSRGVSVEFTCRGADAMLLCTSGDNRHTEQHNERKGPNLDQLRRLEQYVLDMLPNFFKSRMEYRIYHPDIILENNFWGKNEVFTGVNQYAMQMIKCRAMIHLKYAHVHLEAVSSACLENEGIIRVQWRIVGLSQLKALRFWKYSLWNYSNAFKEDAEWLEGISILHVNKDGLVTKHRIDRMSPDEEQVQKSPLLAAKLAVILGLAVPKPGLSDFSSIF